MQQNEPQGGQRLRELRQCRSRTQLDIELEAELGSGYLQRVESGRVKQPLRPTLERILEAIEVESREAEEVLALFGYTSAQRLPTRQEMDWARDCCHDVLQAVRLPTYLLDCAHRLLAWNALIPSLLRVCPGDPNLLQLRDHSIIDVWFDTQSCLGSLVHAAEQFYPQLVQALYHEMLPFRHETWHTALTTRWLQHIPDFRTYWEQAQQGLPSAVAARLLYPIALKGPQGQPLHFRLAAEHFTQDRRFRLLYYIPFDKKTMSVCEMWSQQIAEV
ncbi:hypothetical protein KSF_042860 [Reticulibacter mediterranei]|uniref:HTH cro/C1-type domain-containing protein n=1 Tax=Reticulibacter mediterranei TaxID=2778369 RepID=A0A8J3N3C9_9CHLR|nr:helix-turn-helix transcriptional regulator [Reticulibacter mediterranei]GHO94238.1 hypothetical protein KSF_042860 [Reticulibacter mediterranei]